MQTDYYVFIYTPGPNWLKGQPITKQPLTGHFQYMSRLEDEQKLVLGGGFLDDSGAMGVLQATSVEEARAIIEKDPAVMDGVVTAQVHPWYVTVARPVNKSG